MIKNCPNCGKQFSPDPRNVARGWGVSCSKSCAATLRERKAGASKVPTVRSVKKVRFENILNILKTF